MRISQGDRVKNNELNKRRVQATPRGIGMMRGFYADKAENATLWDVEGYEVIDFAAGIAVLNTGHRHPKVTFYPPSPPRRGNALPQLYSLSSLPRFTDERCRES